MAVYFVLAPQRFPNVIAEVRDAGNSKHARTAFLDYLSRNNLINWSERQNLRKEIMVKRGNPGDMASTVVLEYGQGAPQAKPMLIEEEVRETSTQPERTLTPAPIPIVPERPMMPIAAAARQIGFRQG